MLSSPIIRPANPADANLLQHLIDHGEYVYRHLDWRSPAEWLGEHPFLVMGNEYQLVAALACPDDGLNVRWIRLFAYLRWSITGLPSAWNRLFSQVIDADSTNRKLTYAGLGLQPWFSDLLIKTGFTHQQDIVALSWNGEIPAERPLASEVILRPMDSQDLSAVQAVDKLAFATPWKMTLVDLGLALQQSICATVAELEGQIIGYQITTGNLFHAHLARLAVHPELQRLSIGYALVSGLLRTLVQRGLESVTVNTQSDNVASLSLYKKAHFYQTGEIFPLFTYSTP